MSVDIFYALLLASSPVVPLAVLLGFPFPIEGEENYLGDDPETNTQSTRLHMRILSGVAMRNCCSPE